MSEKQGYREAMVRLQGRMVKHGMSSGAAEKRARDIAVQRDRDAREGTDKNRKR